jgi:PBSX family phage terminase large subunit
MPPKPAHLARPFVATPKQLELARLWSDPDVRVVTFGGAIRSGKTQAAGRVFVETALRMPSTYLVARLTYRELEDSTKKALLHGDGALPALIPPESIASYSKTDNQVTLKNGSIILFRSLDEPGKLLNLTLGAIFVDQIEELDEGEEGERLFDTLLGRLSDPGGPRKLVAVANPGSLTHWVYRRLVDPRTCDAGARYVHVELRDNAENLPPDYVAAMEAKRETRPHWFKSFVQGLWGSFEGAAYEEWDDSIHVVEPFLIPDAWDRFQSLDHGSANPTAVLAWAVDHDGNLIAFDEYYSPGLVSAHAAEIRRRLPYWRGRDERGYSVCYADPSIRVSQGLSSRHGVPASVWTEYLEHGINFLVMANNDRAAGYARLLELVHPDRRRPFPSWHSRSGELGSPRIFVFKTCENLVAQFKSAPVAKDGHEAGEAVDPKWESARGHAHASARYGALSWPAPSPEPPALATTPDEERAYRQREILARYESRMDNYDEWRSSRLVDV